MSTSMDEKDITIERLRNEKKQLLDAVSVSNRSGFFYIIYDSKVLEPDVFKIGMTTKCNATKRLCSYPRYSSQKYTVAVEDAAKFERIVITKFSMLYIRRKKYGNEYFQGDLKDMIDNAHKLWMEYGGLKIVQLNLPQRPYGIEYFMNEFYSDNLGIDIDTAYTIYCEMVGTNFDRSRLSQKTVFVNFITNIIAL